MLEYDPGSSGVKLLLIDDDRLMLSLVKMSLERGGHTVLTADRGEEGLQIAREQGADAILLDWHMPGMSGREILDALLQDDKTKSIPVLFFTGRLDAGTNEEMRAIGAAGLIRKPIIPSNLPDQIKKLTSV